MSHEPFPIVPPPLSTIRSHGAPHFVQQPLALVPAMMHGLIRSGGYVAKCASGYGAVATVREAVSMDGVSNAPGDPSGADGEVQLDIEVAGSVAPGVNIVAYFSSNQGSGFLDALAAGRLPVN